ncbi:hypothetical protein FAGKG844_130078 [Frankia sp. AgKG'84/4]
MALAAAAPPYTVPASVMDGTSSGKVLKSMSSAGSPAWVNGVRVAPPLIVETTSGLSLSSSSMFTLPPLRNSSGLLLISGKTLRRKGIVFTFCGMATSLLPTPSMMSVTVWAGNCSAIRSILSGTVTFSPLMLVTTCVVGAAGVEPDEPDEPQPAARAAIAAAAPRANSRRGLADRSGRVRCRTSVERAVTFIPRLGRVSC